MDMFSANNEHVNAAGKTWFYIDLESMDYRKAWKLQGDLVAARKEGAVDHDIILLLEHPPVITLGRRGGSDNLLVSRAFLEKADIAVIQVERGGNITYHGPGQLVVYPIIDLEAARITVSKFVEALEEVMLQTVGFWGIKAERNSANRGIWVDNKKMGSIGIALRKGISFHGLALNVNLDLAPFSWIQPCGLPRVKMTSMMLESSAELSLDQVREVLKKRFEAVFQVKLTQANFPDLRRKLKQKIKMAADF